MQVNYIRNRVVTTIVAFSVSVGLATATTSEVMVNSSEEAYLNGAPVSAGSAAHRGDKLYTAPYGALQLQLQGSKIEFGHKTRAQVGSDAIELSYGYLRVHGNVGVRDGRHLTRPLSSSTDYEVVRLDRRTYVHVYTGAVNMAGFRKPVTVRAGEAVAYQDLGNAQDANAANSQDQAATNQDNNKKPGADVPNDQTQTTPDTTAGQTQATPDTTASQTQTTSDTTAGQNTGAGQTQTQTAPEQTPPETQTTTTTTVEQVPPGGPAEKAGGVEVPLPVAVGLVVASAVATGLIVHAVTKPSSPSKP